MNIDIVYYRALETILSQDQWVVLFLLYENILSDGMGGGGGSQKYL